MHSFRAAVEAKDLVAVADLLADDVVFYSPIAFKPYEGKPIVSKILETVFTIFEDFHYQHEIGADDADLYALVFGARVDDKQLQGCDFIRTNAEGKIDHFTVMLRPLSATTHFAAKMKVAFEAAMADLAAQA